MKRHTYHPLQIAGVLMAIVGILIYGGTLVTLNEAENFRPEIEKINFWAMILFIQSAPVHLIGTFMRWQYHFKRIKTTIADNFRDVLQTKDLVVKWPKDYQKEVWITLKESEEPYIYEKLFKIISSMYEGRVSSTSLIIDELHSHTLIVRLRD